MEQLSYVQYNIIWNYLSIPQFQRIAKWYANFDTQYREFETFQVMIRHMIHGIYYITEILNIFNSVSI